jgi:hypothetical protein
MISTSPIKISCVIREADVVTAVKAWARAFGLDEDEDVQDEPISVAS